MQNVSRIQKHPDTLIKNFFIGGLTQHTIQKDILPKPNSGSQRTKAGEASGASKGRDMFDLDPEVLFSLYEEPEKMALYLQQVFPDKVRICQTETMVDPKFFSFMSVDVEGFNQYNHCLIFYERFTQVLIQKDFDEKAYIEKLARQYEKAEFKQNLSEAIAQLDQSKAQRESDETQQEGQQQSERQFGNAWQRKKAGLLNQKAPIQTALLKSTINVQKSVLNLEEEINSGISEMKSRATERQQNPAIFQQISSSSQQSSDGGQSAAEIAAKANLDQNRAKVIGSKHLVLASQIRLEEVKEDTNEYLINTYTTNEGRKYLNKLETLEEEDELAYRDSLYGQTRSEALSDFAPSTSFMKKRDVAAPSMSNQINQNNEKAKSQAPQNLPIQVLKPASLNGAAPSEAQPQNAAPASIRQVSSLRASASGPTNPRNKGDCYFAPIAFVIQTEVEHHDLFKEILLSLFESIRSPIVVTGDKKKDLQLAFADFLSHIAFLASLPCPTFNTRYHIEFFDKTLTFAEPNYDMIPDKNQLAIRVLFDMLDVRSIIYCWKALLFDYTLVLISSQNSLQFYIAQALLQLVFPLTFQYSYVQPASSERIGMVGSPFPIIFTCSHTVKHFEYFEDLQKSNIAICDIDGSYTNNLPMPQLEDEKRFLRSLSALKNFKGAKFDSAFHEMYQQDLIDSDLKFTQEVRSVFFGILDQFLKYLLDGEYFKQVEADEDKQFINYFKYEEYLDWFDGTGNKEFAEKLMHSQLFATFCDDYFDKDVSNMLIYINISSNGYNFEADDLADPTMKQEYEKRLKQVELEVRQNGTAQLASQVETAAKYGDDRYGGLKSPATVVSEIRNGACVRMEKCKEIKDWPKYQKIDFCWRMPQNNQRVMIFEKLEYSIQCYDEERRQALLTTDAYFNQKTKGNRELQGVHDEQMRQLFGLITELKKNYRHPEKLPEYARQAQVAQKDLQMVSEKAESSKNSDQRRKDENYLSPVPQELKRNMTERPVGSNFKNDLAAGLGQSESSFTNKEQESDFGSEADSSLRSVSQVNSSKDNGPSIGGEKGAFLPPLGLTREKSDTVSKTSDEVLTDMTPMAMSRPRHMTVQRPLGNDNDMTPKQNATGYVARNNQQWRTTSLREGGPSMSQNQKEFDPHAMMRQADEDIDIKEIFFQQRVASTDYYNQNRIVEICYGHCGLIGFLDLLFTQFPSKKQVKAKFNYYFAIRKQIQAIEHQVHEELEKQHNWQYSQWFENRKVLLETLTPQKSLYVKASPAKAPPISLQPSDSFSPDRCALPQLVPGTSIVFQEDRNGEYCLYKPAEERASALRLWDMQDCKANPLEIKGGGLAVFQQPNVKKDCWMLPVLPERVETEPDSGEFLTEFEKLVAFRTSHQYISLKQKLFFAFEDQEEAIQLIFGEFLLFSQEHRDIFPTYRFYELLEMMTQPQKDRIFRQIIYRMQNVQSIFQLRLMFEHEINGMDADKDEPCSLDHKIFDRDFMIPKPKKANINSRRTETRAENRQSRIVRTVAQGVDKCHTKVAQVLNMGYKPQGESVAMNQSVDCSKMGSHKRAATFDQQAYAQSFVGRKSDVLNGDKRVMKLLRRLILLYVRVFDPENFDESNLRLRPGKADLLKPEFMQIRAQEKEKLSDVTIAFECLLDCDSAREELETIKRCFWINLFNFKTLQKVLEIYLVQPSVLKNQLLNCTMFVAFMQSVKVSLLGHELTCYEIWRTMLRHNDIHLLLGPFEEPVRPISAFPPEIQDLAVKQSHPLTSFALYMPIKKWAELAIYDKSDFESELLSIVQRNNERIHISQDNFLVRIPKYFFWKTPEGASETAAQSRLTSIGAEGKDQGAIQILRKIIDDNLVAPGRTYDAITSVLSQVEAESRHASAQTNSLGEYSFHLFEVDSFWWKFDLLTLRQNIRQLESSRVTMTSTERSSIASSKYANMDFSTSMEQQKF